MSSAVKTLADIGGRIPGWSVIAMFIMLFALLVGGRMLDITENTARGVNNAVNSTEIGEYMPDPNYYYGVARSIWYIVTGLATGIFTIIFISIVANSLLEEGEEV